MKNNKIKTQFITIMAAMFIVPSAMSQNYTTFGVGIAVPVGTLHVNSDVIETNGPGVRGDSDNDENLRVEFLNDYKTTVHITNTNTGTTETDGFSIIQDNLDVILRQHEADGVLKIGNANGSIIMSPTGKIGIGDTNTNYQFNVAANSRVGSNLYVNGASDFNGNVTAKHLTVSQELHVPGVMSAVACTVATVLRASNHFMVGNGLYCDPNGNLRVKSVEVSLSGWPDHVFGKDYKLMTLPETEKFINKHGHLPDIPSAEEVERDGVDLGEMNRLLLQKIEELTLYAIDLQKQIDELKSQIK